MSFQNILWNDNWQFALTNIGELDVNSVKASVQFHDVELPHDWLVGDTRNLYKTGEGWYKKSFTLTKEDLAGVLYACFEGVYMNCSVYVNDKNVANHTYGYSSFDVDFTAVAKEGENEIIVQVRHEAPNSRWYSGAGIYRNVYLKKRNKNHVALNGVYISTENNGDSWTVLCDTEVIGDGNVTSEIVDRNGVTVAAMDGKSVRMSLENPKLWDTENPNLYTMRTTLEADGQTADVVENKFGFRTTEFNVDKGFLLNGKQLKIHGVCNHHDLGALGAAMNKNALRRQFEILRDFGCNSVRTSHNMPSVELMEIADEMGFLIDSESFDMWENPKTEFDNARFFPNTYKQDVAAWVRRDRNHPSLIMWSIGNEIADTHASPRGLEVAKMLAEEVVKHDPRHNARCTIGSNYMRWDNAQKVADFLKLAGYNYTEDIYDKHHEEHPDWFIYGSETASTVRSRGIYHLPVDTDILTHDDLQCSDMGNSVVSWGRAQESAWIMDRDREYCGGQYVWTGFDYIGEPTPYSTKNSYFGIVDTAGMKKDSFYLYKAVWTDGSKSPFIHILPHWDWNEGDVVSVMTYSNVEDVELFFDGESLGKQHVDLKHGNVLHGRWNVAFKKGTLTAKAYNGGNVVAEDTISSFGEAAKIVLKPEKTSMCADGRDLIYVEISTVDKDGNFVANARSRVNVSVSGAARLVGLDSGDSTDYDSYKGSSKRLFSGRLMAILQASFDSGNISVTVTSDGLEGADVALEARACEKPQGVSVVKEYYPCYVQPDVREIPLRKIELIAPTRHLDEDNATMHISAKLYPENATYKDINYKCVLDNGVETQIASVRKTDDGVFVTAKGDGKFILRAMCSNGRENPEIISDLALEITGLGEALTSPYTFISAAFHKFSDKPLRVVERGQISGFVDRTVIGFENVDFGSYGSDILRLYVGNSDTEKLDIEVWLGNPDIDGEKLDTVTFPKNALWDRFAPLDFTLSKRIKGVQSIAFVISQRCVFGGFEFVKYDKAKQKLVATDNDAIYGDEFKIVGESVENIGNNVVLEFKDMDFGAGVTKITVCGRTPHENDTMQIRYNENGMQKTQLVEFKQSDEYVAREFTLQKISGLTDVSFVFLPGARFDFGWFKFGE